MIRWPDTFLAALALVVFFSVPVNAQEASAADAGKSQTEIFKQLDEGQREVVLGQLQQLLGASIETAKSAIRENGEIRPFAYVGDFQAKGRFVRLNEDQEVPANLALVAIQRMVVNAAVDGTLAASLLYVTAENSGQLTEDLRKRFTDSLSETNREIEDVRFLLIEMQHVAGLGLLHVVPYWKSGNDWEIGGALQQTIGPRLHQVVKARAGKPGKQS